MKPDYQLYYHNNQEWEEAKWDITVLKLDTWLGCEKQCQRFILWTHSLEMLWFVSTNMLFYYQLFIGATQTSASCESADLYIIKMNLKIKTIVDRCLSHIFNWSEWYVTAITVVLLPFP